MSSNQIVMSFHSDAVKDDTLLVAAAEGVEALAQPFRFDLDLVSADPGLDLAAILRVNARISLNRTMDLGDGRSGDIAYDYHGVLTSIHQVSRVGNSSYRYRAVLRPRWWKLAQTRRSRIFTNKSVPQLLKVVLDEAGIEFEEKFSDMKVYPINPYMVQYEETDLDFISRWMEHVGISYYYDSAGDLGTMVLIDNAHGYTSINQDDPSISFDDQAVPGVWSSGHHQRIRTCEVEEICVPKLVQLKEYNYESPANELRYEIVVDPVGSGTWYEYNSNYRTESEAKFLLEVRRGYWLGLQKRLRGVTDHRSFQAGRTFTLKGHYNPQMNDESFALVETRHHVSQVNGNDVGMTGAYTCDFMAIPAALVFRPERVTEWPSIHGVVHARTAGGALDFAEIDGMGRYKIDVDYDTNDQTIGKVRMAQPSVGEDAGVHFPLRNNTEVLIGHIDGDPDKPVILGAVHDASKPNVVNQTNDPLGTISRVKSQGGNVMEMQDDGPHKSLVLANGNLNTIQMFGRANYQHSTEGSSSQNADSPKRAMGRVGSSGTAVVSKRPAPSAESKSSNNEMSSAQFSDPPSTEASYAISPSLLVDPGDTIDLHVYNPQPDYVYVWFIKRMTTADEDTFIYEAPTRGVNAALDPIGITRLSLDHDLVPMTEAEKDTLHVYGALSCTIASIGRTASLPPDSIFPFTIPPNSENWSWEISCIPYKAATRTGMWVRDLDKRQFLTTVECNQTSDHPLVQQFFEQLKLMGSGVESQSDPKKIKRFDMVDPATGNRIDKAIVSREFKDFARSVSRTTGAPSELSDIKKIYDFPGVPQDNRKLADMVQTRSSDIRPAAITAAASIAVNNVHIGQPIGQLSQNFDAALLNPKIPGISNDPVEEVDRAFANYEASYGGAQTISIGRNIELSYGDSWEKKYGNSYAWSRGESFEVNLGGSSFSYHLASHDEVSWAKGTVREYSFGDNKESYSYIDTEKSYSKVKTKTTEVSEKEESESTETVYKVAKSTSNIGRKEEFEDVGASVNLACGGAQFEMSLNGPKVSIEGALSLAVDLSAKIEMSLAAVIEISAGVKLEIGGASTFNLESLKMKMTVSDMETAAMATKLTALKAETLAAAKTDVAAYMHDGLVGMKGGGAGLEKLAVKMATGFNIQL